MTPNRAGDIDEIVDEELDMQTGAIEQPVNTGPRLTRQVSTRGERGISKLLARLLSLSLFYKVLIANSAIVLIGAIAGTAITADIAQSAERGAFDAPLAIIGFAVAGIALTFTLNAIVLRAALSPLERLRGVVERVHSGDLDVRAQPSPLDDAQLRRLVETLNQMLDEVQGYEAQVRALSGRIIYAQEDERHRIAHELHDDTGQVLTLLLIRLKLLEATEGAEAVAPKLAELRGIVTSAIDQVRRLALNLRPPTIDQLGLFPSLRSLGATFQENTGIVTSLDLPRVRVILPPESTLVVYRVVQEALTNIAKHSGASHVSVTVKAVENNLYVIVSDDGRGFAPDAHPCGGSGKHRAGAGIGLFGMEERARLVGGTLQVVSVHGQGSSITLTVPLQGQEEEREAGVVAQSREGQK